MIEKLTPVEFNKLSEKVFSEFNTSFKIESVETVSAGKKVSIKLKDGGKKTVVISLPLQGVQE